MIKFENLSFNYGEKIILQDIDIEVPEGEFLCLLGQSGCGKSTLLRLAAGLAAPNVGAVKIAEKQVAGPDRNCAVVFQDYSLFPWLSTGHNLVLALRSAFPDKAKKELQELAQSYLEMVGLANAFGKYPASLSGGMRQRAAIARALAVDSPILLMDEPFGALDPLNRAMLQDLLRQLFRKSGKKRTVLFVTHDVEEALYLGNRIIVLASSPGRVIADRSIGKRELSNRNAFFAQEEIKNLQSELLDLYRQDTLRKLEADSLQLNGSGI